MHVETGRHFYGGAQQVVWLVTGLGAQNIDCKLVCPPGSDLSAVARDAGIDAINLSCAGDLDVTFAWRLRQLLVKERPDIVHCHSRRGADFLGGQAAAMTGIPAVVSRRVDSTEPGAIAGLRYRPFSKVIAISQHIADLLLEGGLDEKRMALIRSSVDAGNMPVAADDSLMRQEFGIVPGNFAIAIAAQLIPRKGHSFLFEALAGLHGANRNIRLVVFGTGALETELRIAVTRMNLGGVVQFAGFRRDFDRLLPGFDLLVHPAIREGLGVAMLKAAAARIPVVAFDVAGAREAVVHGETGLLVPVEDVGALRNAITKLVEYPALRVEYGRAGRQRMLDEFSVESMVEQHLQLYETVINGRV
jgi:glycosyltransferase involved in cell wall biosynthesis